VVWEDGLRESADVRPDPVALGQLRVSVSRAVAHLARGEVSGYDASIPGLLTCPSAQVLDGAPQALRVVPAPVFVAIGPADERGPSVPVPTPCEDRCGVPAAVGEQHDRLRPCGREPVRPDQLTLRNAAEDRPGRHRPNDNKSCISA
jgi:hypothetical protein